MRSIEIHKLAARYRLPRSADDERRRLDHLLRMAMADGAFEEALAQEGVPTEGELCIRNIYATARLRLSGTDRGVARAWSAALAQAIKRAMYGGQVSGIAHYSSRVQALIDMATGVSLGDTSRVWAWRQLGLWSAGQSVSDAGRVGVVEATGEVVSAFEREPALIVPTLRALARERLLERLTVRFSTGQWMAIASAALLAVNSSLRVDRVEEALTATASPDFAQQARRLVSASVLFPALAVSASARPSVARAMAVLTILEVNPAALSTRAETSHALTGAVAQLLTSARNASSESISGSIEQSPRLAATPNDLNEATGTLASAPADRDREEDATRAQAELEANEMTRASDLARAVQSAQELAAERAQETIEHDYQRTETDERSLPVVRQYAFTRFGGLLFLLGVVEDLGLPELMLANAALSARSFRWMMQRLALALLPAIEASDPAVMAFAGLAPDDDSPAASEEPPTEMEDDAIKLCAESIKENLRARLEPLDETETDVAQFVCVRRAELVFDPGWIEAHLSLDDVSTKIRGAGLDLDPGYLPWLGVVVKFIYE